MLSVSLPFALALSAGMLWLPPSPRWLVLKAMTSTPTPPAAGASASASASASPAAATEGLLAWDRGAAVAGPAHAELPLAVRQAAIAALERLRAPGFGGGALQAGRGREALEAEVDEMVAGKRDKARPGRSLGRVLFCLFGLDASQARTCHSSDLVPFVPSFACPPSQPHRLGAGRVEAPPRGAICLSGETKRRSSWASL